MCRNTMFFLNSGVHQLILTKAKHNHILYIYNIIILSKYKNLAVSSISYNAQCFICHLDIYANYSITLSGRYF